MKKTQGFSLLISIVVCTQSWASPWVEADDPFLRSDVQFLTDCGLLSMPTNTYPVRWSFFNDQFSRMDIEHLSPAEELAYHSVDYRLDSERLGRGRNHLTLSGASDAQAGNNGFGGYQKTKAGMSISHEIMEDQFAFRIASGLRQADDKNERWNFDNSYFAVASNDFSMSFGWLPRWWGPGWMHSSGIAEQSYPLPSFSVSYLKPKIPVVGSLWLETLIAKQNNDAADSYLSASRLALKPTSHLQLGATYKSWFGGDESENKTTEWAQAITAGNSNGLYSMDARLSSALPLQGAGGIYAEEGQTRQNTLKYRMIGTDAQWLISNQSVRWVIEYAEQKESSDNYYLQTLEHRRASIISIPADHELSVGSYWQLSTDQQISLFWHNTVLDENKSVNRITGQFKQPMLAGLVTFNTSFLNKPITGQDRNNFGINYEYRFN